MNRLKKEGSSSKANEVDKLEKKIEVALLGEHKETPTKIQITLEEPDTLLTGKIMAANPENPVTEKQYLKIQK